VRRSRVVDDLIISTCAGGELLPGRKTGKAADSYGKLKRRDRGRENQENMHNGLKVDRVSKSMGGSFSEQKRK